MTDNGGLQKTAIKKKTFTHLERNLMQTNQYLRDMLRRLLDRPRDPGVKRWATSVLEAAETDAAMLAAEADTENKPLDLKVE